MAMPAICAVGGVAALLCVGVVCFVPAAPRLAAGLTPASAPHERDFGTKAKVRSALGKMRRRAGQGGSGRYDAPANLLPPDTAERSATGLAWEVITPPTGEDKPSGDSCEVTVHYSGWKSSDGQLFDSSYLRNEPSAFKVGEVIPGWKEGLRMMKVGEKRRLWVPGSLAYGEEDAQGQAQNGPPTGALVFEVELRAVDDPGASIISTLGTVAAFLFFCTVAQTFLGGSPAERPEYDTQKLTSFKKSGGESL